MTHRSTRRSTPSAALALTTALLAGTLAACSDDPAPEPAEASASATPAPAYDGSLAPSEAVLALVPQDVAAVAVSDHVEAEREAVAPVLGAGRLGGTALAGAVAWEATLYGGDGAERGWVVAFREGTDLGQVSTARGPLKGGAVDAADRLVTSGTASDPSQSWAADPELVALVGQPGNATYFAQGCVVDEPAGATRLADLAAYSVQFQGTLATARLGAGREDLFDRLRLGTGDAEFSATYTDGVADPSTGRLGFVMANGQQAAQLALRHDLPFAACGTES